MSPVRPLDPVLSPGHRRCKDKYTAMLNFVASVETGSYVKAADRLGLSPSAISVSITRLEVCLGVRLLRRTTRTMIMTPQGKTFYALAKPIVELTQKAFAEDLFDDQPATDSGMHSPDSDDG